ncbi:MAG: homocysteine S-methyltransferase family protein [Clostridia bacterium]|nr:homocysteine S-methyltransferase family protein [Clostridia bacterium]
MSFLEDVQRGKHLLFDGAMGTMLEKKGLGLSGGVNNIEHQDVVTTVHKEYIAAGSDCILTNTFSLNKIYADTHNLDIDLKQANIMGVAAAKKAVQNAGRKIYIFGDLGPTGLMLKPLGLGEPEEILAAYKDQAKVLADEGVDGFMVETMFDVEEALLAIKAIREVSKLPIVASVTFSTPAKGGRTIMGNSAADCAKKFTEAGACVVGTNCGDIDIKDLANIIANMKEAVDTPLILQANAGKPELVDLVTSYNMSPADYAANMADCLKAGAQILGGCCGTTPDHIAALKALV